MTAQISFIGNRKRVSCRSTSSTIASASRKSFLLDFTKWPPELSVEPYVVALFAQNAAKKIRSATCLQADHRDLQFAVKVKAGNDSVGSSWQMPRNFRFVR
jgi:hypothetical protein